MASFSGVETRSRRFGVGGTGRSGLGRWRGLRELSGVEECGVVGRDFEIEERRELGRVIMPKNVFFRGFGCSGSRMTWVECMAGWGVDVLVPGGS